MSSEEFIDVVIPTYNSTHELNRAVQSVLSQENINLGTVIIVDDGSSKEVRNFLKKRFNDEPSIMLLFDEHSGHPGVLRKKGIQNSKSEWIAFLDSDDWWDPYKLKKQLDFAKENSYEAVVCNAKRWTSIGESEAYFCSEISQTLNLIDLIKDNLTINSSLLVRRSILVSAGFYADSQNSRRAEDYATALRIVYLTRIGYLSSELVNYKDYGQSFKKSESSNPRIFAWIDFLCWLSDSKKQLKLKFKLAIFRAIWREYVKSL